MNIFFPTIGDSIKLTQDCNVKVYVEHRNRSLLEELTVVNLMPDSLGYVDWYPYPVMQTYDVVLKSGTILIVDRIYIRKGNAEYSSITFRATIPNIKKKQRFWLKLDMANTLIGDWL